MKKGLILVLVLFFVVGGLFFGEEKTIKKQGMLYRGEQFKEEKLVKNQMLSVTQIVKKPVYLDVTNWSKVKIISDFFDELKGHTEFDNAEKYRLLSYIFDNLPINGEDGVIRVIYIGDYFGNKSPMEIRVGVLTPKGDALLKNEKAIIILSNVFKTQNGELSKATGFFSGYDSNACVISGLKDKRLTNVQMIKKADSLSENEIRGKDSISQIMFVQNYLADDDTENDATSINILNAILDVKAETPAIHIMAMLKKYEYFLSRDEIADAELLWSDIKEYSKNVPGDMNPESLESLNGESLYLMKRLTDKPGV